jgi:hypothetical protein
LIDGFGRLLTQHVTLAKLELMEDVRAMGMDLVQVLTFIPFVLMAYALFCGAVVTALAPRAGWVGAFLWVGLGNTVIGVVGVGQALSRIRARPVMEQSAAELRESAAALSNGAQEPNSLGGPHAH